MDDFTAGLSDAGSPSGLAPPAEDSAVEQFLDRTSIGRVLDSFGQGAKAGWGARPLGLTPETEKALRDFGVFRDVQQRSMDSLRAFNEGLIRPAAGALDLVLRGVSAGAAGVANLTGTAADETGLSEAVGLPGTRLTRDMLTLAETVGVLMGEPRPSLNAPTVSIAKKPDVQVVPRAVPEKIVPETAVQAFDKAGEGIIDRAGNINLDRIFAAEDVKEVIRQAAVDGNAFPDATRGVVPMAQTEELAQALGMTPKELTSRNVGQAFNAEEALAARNLLVQSATSVRDLAVKATAGKDGDLLGFQEAVTRHLAIQEQVAGMTAEAGRALNSFKILARDTGEAKDLGAVLEALGGRESIDKVARRITELDTPQAISQFLNDARKPTFSDMAIEAWINALLSGPVTHVKNIVSNTATALWSVPETAGAATVGAARRVMGWGGDESVMFGEAGARLFGIVQGSKDGIKAGWRTFKTEIPSYGGPKIEVRRPQAIPSANVTVLGHEFELGGRQVRIPGRLLSAEDEVFKAIAYRQELNALAYRQASTEGLAGDAFTSRIAELVAQPTGDVVAKARANADYQTFTKELGRYGKTVQDASNNWPLLKLVIPFVRTPLNLIKYAGERSPFGLASREVRDILSGAQGDIARDTQIARLAMGSAAGITAASAAASGHITGGGPKDPRQRAVLYLTGWQPYSIRVGDMYYNYNWADPFAPFMGVAADMHEVARHTDDLEMEKLANMVTSSISKNLVNKTWMQGPADFLEAFENPERYGERYIRKMFGTVVPTVAAHIAKLNDPVLHDARTILDGIKARVPGLSRDLLPRRDIFGEPIALEGALGPDMLSPIYEKQISHDPVAQEFLALKIWPAPVDREIRGVKLTDKQYDDYARVAGRFTRFNLSALVTSPGWSQIPAWNRHETIKTMIANSRAAATSLVLMENPDIIQKAVDLRMKQIAGADR